MMPPKKCEACNKDLFLGSTKYNVKVEILSDFDGFLPEFENDDAEKGINGILEELDRLSATELEEDVHVEIEMTLCPECKHRLIVQLESYTDGNASVKQRHCPSLH